MAVRVNNRRDTGLVAALLLLGLLFWPRKSKGWYVEGEYGNISHLFGPLDVLQSDTADAAGIEEQYENVPGYVYDNAKLLAQNVLDAVYYWWQLNGYDVTLDVNSWWRSDALVDYMIEHGQASEPETDHKTGGTADVELYFNGENRNDMFIQAILIAGISFDQMVIEEGTIERPAWIHIEWNPELSGNAQRKIIGRIKDGSYSAKSLQWAEDTYLD